MEEKRREGSRGNTHSVGNEEVRVCITDAKREGRGGNESTGSREKMEIREVAIKVRDDSVR